MMALGASDTFLESATPRPARQSRCSSASVAYEALGRGARVESSLKRFPPVLTRACPSVAREAASAQAPAAR